MSTALDNKEEEIQIPRWYFEFVAAVVRQLPRPGNGKGRINKETAIGYSVAQAKLQKALADGLLPKPTPAEVSKDSIIEFVDVIEIPETTEKFVAKENFKLKKDGGIFSFIDYKFCNWFLNGEGKIEDPSPAHILHSGSLKVASVGRIILEELGEAKAEVALRDFFDLLSRQCGDEEGVLLLGGNSNSTHVLDTDGILRVVYAIWSKHEQGWHVLAASVTDSGHFFADRRVIYSDF